MVPTGQLTAPKSDAVAPASDAARPVLRLSSVALLAVVYFLAIQFGLRFRFQNAYVGVGWLAKAVLLTALLHFPRSRWWLVLLATSLAYTAAVGVSTPDWRVLWQIAGTAAFTASTAEVLHRLVGLPLHLGSRRQVLVYTGTAILMSAFWGLTAPTFVRGVLGFQSANTPWGAFVAATVSNATALLLVVPVILLWSRSGVSTLRAMSGPRQIEAAAMMLSLLAVGLVAFTSGPETARLPWVLFWIFPPLLWAAVRFGPLGASTSLFVVMALSAAGAARHVGLFVATTNGDQVSSLQLFWIVLSLPVMLLAAAVREREQVESALEDQRNQLAHVTRVATAGELSGALAHELRQPLMAILANAQAATRLLQRPSCDVVELRAILDDIVEQDQQAAGVIARVRSFIKEGKPQFEPLAMETVVRDALAMGRSAIAFSGVDVQTQIARGLPRVSGDPVQLLQVVLNLIVNSCESMKSLPAPDRRLRLLVAPTGDDHVEVQVTDQGVGLPRGEESRVFEPFFTTKDEGLGLGLAIGRSIAAAHGGRLWAENNRRGGATFHLVLPTRPHQYQHQ